jgi:plastocyanin
MRKKAKKLPTLGATALLTVSLFAGGTVTAPPASASVTKIVKMATSLRFMPMTITIHKGDYIKWKNPSGSGLTHTSTSTSSLWNSGNVTPGHSFTRRFRRVGTFKYYCRYHRRYGMTGKIIVNP